MTGRRAGDIMIPLDRYPHIPYWFTLRQAIAELRASEIEVQGRTSLPRAVLVFNKAYELLGIVRRRDILRGLGASGGAVAAAVPRARHFELNADPNLSDFSSDRLARGLRERAQRPVSDVMVPITVTLDYDDSLMKIVAEMVGHDMSLVPVLQDGRVVGVVRSVDVLHEIAEIVLA